MPNNKNLSPRQVANKAYTLAVKKLDRDDKRKRPQYSVRERLLLSNTMAKAEDVLNKKHTFELKKPIQKEENKQPNESLLAVAVAAAVVYSSIQKNKETIYGDCRPISVHTLPTTMTTMI